MRFDDGWSIKPDMIIEMPKDVPVPATGTINYKNILVKVNFPEDRWVYRRICVRATAGPAPWRRSVRPPGSDFMKDAVPGGVSKVVSDGRRRAPDPLGKFNPGLGGQDFSLFESAKFVPKGSDIVFSMHYTAIGKAATDRSSSRWCSRRIRPNCATTCTTARRRSTWRSHPARAMPRSSRR